MTAIYAPAPATCTCGFTTRDLHLLASHSCDVQENGGRCEDFPCCGHEYGDCNGGLYGSDEAIKASVYAAYYAEDDYMMAEYPVLDPEDCEHDDGEWESPTTARCMSCDTVHPFDWS